MLPQDVRQAMVGNSRIGKLSMRCIFPAPGPSARRIQKVTLSFAEVDSQHVELLPPRTVMSMFTAGGKGGGRGDVITVEGNHVCGVSIGQLGIGVGILGLGLGNLAPGKSC
jgi:hypothetical protein